MANRQRGWLACAGLLAMLSGCVERRFAIETSPPGTKVYVNNRAVGFTPVDVPFTYYGTYQITLEAPGYQTQTLDQRIAPTWYAYPPIDLVAENIYPFKVSDIRRLHYEMTPLTRPNLDQLRQDAEELRERGRNLEEPSIPATPRPGRTTAPPGPTGPPLATPTSKPIATPTPSSATVPP